MKKDKWLEIIELEKMLEKIKCWKKRWRLIDIAFWSCICGILLLLCFKM